MFMASGRYIREEGRGSIGRWDLGAVTKPSYTVRYERAVGRLFDISKGNHRIGSIVEEHFPFLYSYAIAVNIKIMLNPRILGAESVPSAAPIEQITQK